MITSLPAMGLVLQTIGAAEPIDPGRFEKQVLVGACQDPLQMEIRPNGDIYFIERAGKIKVFKAATAEVLLIGNPSVFAQGEIGLIGMTVDPKFDENHWIYLLMSRAQRPLTVRLSRFTVGDAGIDPASEKVLLEYNFEKQNNHMSGEMEFGPDGLLYIGTGDNTPPTVESGFDQRAGRENFDSLRTSANTMDLRGKILRIAPHDDGSYAIPAGNLFPDGKEGRPEIYAMGCRNPFRFSFDRRTGWLYFGDVGPNTDRKFGSEGYDEFNIVKDAGNYGWPMFVGPNEAYRWYDFATGQIGQAFDVRDPVNPSRNNRGLRRLPSPRAAMIWYPSGSSAEFPELGSGARSAMSGSIFYDDPRYDAMTKLPPGFEGCWFIYDWARNWIKVVRRKGDGTVASIEPFLPGWRFRKPIDLKVGPDGAMYLIEYGDNWFNNGDSQISRIVYRRGNRAPVAVGRAQPAAGREPLAVRFSAAGSHDEDAGDVLRYTWDFGTGQGASPEHEAVFTYDRPGVYAARLTVTDAAGAQSQVDVPVAVGNAVPRVTLGGLAPGGFFDWGKSYPYEVGVEDEEDGSSSSGGIDGSKVAVRGEYQVPRPAGQEPVASSPGESLMRRSTCFACHSRDHATLGPPYLAVAARYRGQPSARETLAQKVISGGAGVWGAIAMPPHPQHSLIQTRQMVDWVLSLGDDPALSTASGMRGTWMSPPQAPPGREGGVYVLWATYTDSGAQGVPPQTGRMRVVLHSRRKNAVFCDESRGVEVIDVFDGGIRQAGQFVAGGYIGYRAVNLRGIEQVTVEYAAPPEAGGRLEMRADSPVGPRVAAFDLVPTGRWHSWAKIAGRISDPGGVHDLYLVAQGQTGRGPLFNLDHVDFLTPGR